MFVVVGLREKRWWREKERWVKGSEKSGCRDDGSVCRGLPPVTAREGRKEENKSLYSYMEGYGIMIHDSLFTSIKGAADRYIHGRTGRHVL